jgi:RNA-dependent RNA polymerase
VVRGVNVKALWHLKDVVVLPQTGDRDIAGMCSGGDLDGDDYLVIWDPELFPKEWNHKPMDYTPQSRSRWNGK